MSGTASQLVVANNTFDTNSSTTAGLFVGVTGTTIPQLVVSDNTFTSNTVATGLFFFQSTATLGAVTVTGNTFTGNVTTGDGLFVFGGSGTGVSSFTMTGNRSGAVDDPTTPLVNETKPGDTTAATWVSLGSPTYVLGLGQVTITDNQLLNQTMTSSNNSASLIRLRPTGGTFSSATSANRAVISGNRFTSSTASAAGTRGIHFHGTTTSNSSTTDSRLTIQSNFFDGFQGNSIEFVGSAMVDTRFNTFGSTTISQAGTNNGQTEETYGSATTSHMVSNDTGSNRQVLTWYPTLASNFQNHQCSLDLTITRPTAANNNPTTGKVYLDLFQTKIDSDGDGYVDGGGSGADGPGNDAERFLGSVVTDATQTSVTTTLGDGVVAGGTDVLDLIQDLESLSNTRLRVQTSFVVGTATTTVDGQTVTSEIVASSQYSRWIDVGALDCVWYFTKTAYDSDPTVTDPQTGNPTATELANNSVVEAGDLWWEYAIDQQTYGPRNPMPVTVTDDQKALVDAADPSDVAGDGNGGVVCTPAVALNTIGKCYWHQIVKP
ncbi:MAG: hypothetical protein LBL92_02320 [Propionibacteriaceae bacterium]|nr:hypothetical protein [Propionibacteriaceae bacterium]